MEERKDAFIGGRLRAIRESMGMKQNEFAEMLGIKFPTYSQYENDKREMPIEYLVLLNMFHNVSSDYLLTGKGDIYSNVNKLKIVNNEKGTSSGGILEIPVMNKSYSKNWLDGKNMNMIDISEKILELYPPKRLKFFQIFGDSMIPTLYPNDWVCVCEGLKSGDGIYMISDPNNPDEYQIKRLQFMPNLLIISSDNNRYKGLDVELDSNPYLIIGKVIMKIDKNI